jgi:hypothetical protein
VSKKKRVRRDLDKFYRMGRYWDFLRLLEDEGLVAENQKEHQEAWKAVIKQAVTQEPAFTQFCRQIEAFKTLPKTPDLRLLMFLKNFIEGQGPAAELPEPKGLTPDAEKLRSSFAAFASSSMQLEKLGTLLEKFVREPDKITRRYFEKVAELLPRGFLGANVKHLGGSIPQARSFNSKAAVARGWNGVDSRLESLDRRLLSASRGLPEALAEVLLHPFVHNLAVMCRRLAPEARNHRAVQLVRSIPFLLARLAGEKLPEIEKKLLIDHGQPMDGSHHDLGAFQRKLEGLRIEEKATLLRGLRLKAQDRPAEDDEIDDLDLFDDEDDDFDEEDGSFDDPFDHPGPTAVALAGSLLTLYLSIFKDISHRLGELSARERKELVRVMEPILIRDLDFIFDTLESIDEFVSFLGAAIGAGCAGPRMGLLAVLAGACYRKGELRKRAEKLLDQAPAPTEEDMKWLSGEWGELYFPRAQALKPLLVRYQNQKELLAVLTAQICGRVEFELIESTVKSQLAELPWTLSEILGRRKSKELETLRRELDGLAEFEALDAARHLLRCYSDGRLTLEGHLCWLNALHSTSPEGAWGYALDELERYKHLSERGGDFLPQMAFEILLADKVKAVLLFVQEHADELATLPMDTLEPLLDDLLRHPKVLRAHHTLLIRLEKLLAERLERGEKNVRPLMGRIKQSLLELARPEKKPRKTRKGKR